MNLSIENKFKFTKIQYVCICKCVCLCVYVVFFLTLGANVRFYYKN